MIIIVFVIIINVTSKFHL